MPVLTCEHLLAELKRAPLLTAAQLARVEEAVRQGAHPPNAVVQHLVAKGWLTAFQGEALLSGRPASALSIGPYLLLDRLGEGGMGAVFKARHRRLDRVDAVKVIRADKVASKVIARRFLREIRLTSTLAHPHVVRAIDAGHAGRQLYLATEFVKGEDLGSTVRRHGPLSVADACLVMYQTALALQHVHEHGLVHRDVKPSNLMREESTRAVKLLDLGLSGFHRPTDGGSFEGTLTADGVMLGTPDFMAPEQAQNPHRVDIRADLYGLGCTCYFLLTGRPPYLGSSVDKLIAHATAPIPPLNLPGGPAPAALAAVVGRLMAKRPEDRYPTPNALIEALLTLRPGQSPPSAETSSYATDTLVCPAIDEWQSEFDQLVSQDRSYSSPPALSGHRKTLPVRSRWGLIALAFAAAVCVATVAAVVGSSRGRVAPVDSAQHATHAPAEEAPADELRALRTALNTQGEDRDRLRSRVLEFRARHPGTPLAAAAAGILRKLPSPPDRLAPPPDPRTRTPLVKVCDSGAPVVGLGFIPADSKLFVLRQGAAAEEWDVLTGKETGRLKGLSVADRDSVSMAQDGTLVALGESGGKLLIVRGSDGFGQVRPVSLGTGLEVRVVGACPDGKTAVVGFTSPDERLGRVDLESGRLLGRVEHRSVGVRSVVVSPDGGSCLVTGDDDVVRVFSTSTGEQAAAFEPVAGLHTPQTAVFGPESQRLYVSGIETGVGRFSTGSRGAALRYEVPARSRRAVNWLNPWRIRLQFVPPSCLAVSADEAAVAVGARTGEVQLFAAASGKPTHGFLLPGSVCALAFSTSGRALAVALDGGAVYLIPIKG